MIKGFVNVIGSQFADTLKGVGSSILTGKGGNDTLIGQGTDTVAYTGSKNEYTIAFDAAKGAYTITDLVQSRDGVDTVSGVKFLQFADQTYKLPPAGSLPIGAAPTTGPLVAYSPLNANVTSDPSTRYYRPAATSWSGEQLWTISATSVASYIAPTTTAPNPVNSVDVIITPQNRLGELGMSGATVVPRTKVASSYNDLNVSAAFAMTFGKTGSNVNSGVFWLDLGSATSKTYSLNFKPFTFTPFDVAPNSGTPGAITLGTAVTPTVLSGFTNTSKWVWNDSASGFAFAWSKPNASVTTNSDVSIAFFDATGSLNKQQSITGLGSQITWGLADDLNDSTTSGPGFYFYTVDNSSATITFAKKFDKSGELIADFTPLSFRTLFDVGGIKASNFIYTNYNTGTTQWQNVEFAVSGLRGGVNVIEFYKTDANLVPLVTQELTLTGAVVNNYIQSVRLPGGLKTVFAYQDGSNLHLTELGDDGKFIQDITTNLGANATFDRLRSLSNGLLEIEFRTPGATANTTLLNTQIFDTRTGLLSTSLTGQFIAGQAGVAITTSSDNAVVVAKPNEVITNTGANGTISYEDSSAAVTVTLNASA
ncbi:MAG: hypothetical protein WCK04_06440, partial [Actinomycetes bacterium]